MTHILSALYNSNVWLSINTLAVLSQTCRSAFYFRQKLNALHYKYIFTVYRRNLLQYSITKHKHYCNYVWTENVLRYVNRMIMLKYFPQATDTVDLFGYISQSKYNMFVHFMYCANSDRVKVTPQYIVKKDGITHTHSYTEYRECDWCTKCSLRECFIFNVTIGTDIFDSNYARWVETTPSRKFIDYQSQYYRR